MVVSAVIWRKALVVTGVADGKRKCKYTKIEDLEKNTAGAL